MNKLRVPRLVSILRIPLGFSLCLIGVLLTLSAFGVGPTVGGGAARDDNPPEPLRSVLPNAEQLARITRGEPASAQLQALKPQVSYAVGFGETKALRDLEASPEAAMQGRLLNDPTEVNPKNTTVELTQPPGAPKESVDGTLRKAVTNGSAAQDQSVTPPPISSFEAIANTDNNVAGLGLVNPPDVNADVSFTQIVQTVNSVFRVFDKTGNPLTPVLKMSTLFKSIGGQCAQTDPGDPIVLYDRMADRWQISQFNFASSATPPYHQCIAISKTNDAAGEYYVYDFVTPGGANASFPDYPHLGVWPDAYYMSTRQFAGGASFAGLGAFAFNRAKMLAGDPAAEQIFFLIPNDATYPSTASSGIMPADHDGILPPPPGEPNVFAIHDADEFGGTDSVRLFNFRADFVTPANSTFTQRPESPIAVPAFDGRNPSGRTDIEQPPSGTTTASDALDSIGDRLMFRLAYRNRSGVESLVTNHTVNVSGVQPTNAGTYQAGSRYYEFRKSNPNDPYTLHDAATYAPDANNGASGLNRWMGSTATDNQGNLAMGYSASSTTVVPSINYVGRAFDELGSGLTNEQVLFPGQGTQASGSQSRWGDYTSMSVDPNDECTFWYTNEYYPTGNTTFAWRTRIGNFRFPTCSAPAEGTLTGTITTCDSQAPVGEVLVQATGGPSEGYSVATANDGTYSLRLAPGTYTITVSSGIRNCGPAATTTVTIPAGGTANFSTCLSGVANLILPENDPTPATLSGGDGNGQIDRDECNTLSVDLQNAGCAVASDVNATLSTTTPGVTITQPNSAYSNIPVDGVVANTIPFGVTTSDAFLCGTPITFTLTTTYPGGSDVQTFTLPTCQAPPSQFSGTVQAGDPQTPNGRLGRNAVSSTCSGKACPGLFPATGGTPRSYDTYTFTNAGGVPACATVNLSSTCGGTILASAYRNTFNPTNLCENYLGDAGSSSTAQKFDVTVPAGESVVVVVMEASAGTTCAYTGSVSGLTQNTSGGGVQCAFPEIAVEQPAGTDIPDGGSAAFGSVSRGSNAERMFTVRNTGTANLTGLGITVDGPNASDFTVTTPPAGPLAPSASTTFTVRFTPSAVGARNAALHIANNDPDETSFDISLTGSGVNNPPVANGQNVTATEDTPKDITLSGSDSNGDAISFSIVTQPTNGTLSGTPPNVTYTPRANFNGTDSFTFRVSDGMADSPPATVSIAVAAVNDAPVANSQSVTVNEDSSVAITLTGSDVDADTLTFSVVGQPANGTLSGTPPNLTYTPRPDFNGTDSFTFKVNDGTTDSPPATVSITVTDVAELKSLNISTRGRVGIGDRVMIAGTIVRGTATKRVIFRAIGPSLSGSGINSPLADPVMELYTSNGTLLRTNDNWKDEEQQAEVEATGLQPSDDRESAIVTTLPPSDYTAIVRGKDQTEGVALAEIYDLDRTADSKLANLSTRVFVETGENVVIGGFILGPGSGSTGNSDLVIRGIGPSLASSGVGDNLADPVLELRDGNGALVLANDNWQDNSEQAAKISASGLAPQNPQESAIAVALAPGGYTAIISGKAGTSGIGLVEIYNLD